MKKKIRKLVQMTADKEGKTIVVAQTSIMKGIENSPIIITHCKKCGTEVEAPKETENKTKTE